MQFLSDQTQPLSHFIGSIFHLLGMIILLIAVFKLLIASQRGDLMGSGLQSALLFIVGMFCSKM